MHPNKFCSNLHLNSTCPCRLVNLHIATTNLSCGCNGHLMAHEIPSLYIFTPGKHPFHRFQAARTSVHVQRTVVRPKWWQTLQKLPRNEVRFRIDMWFGETQWWDIDRTCIDHVYLFYAAIIRMSCFQRASEQKTNLYCVLHWDQAHNKTREETMIYRINFWFLIQLIETDTMIQLKSELLKILRQRLDNLEVKGQQHSDTNVHPRNLRYPKLQFLKGVTFSKPSFWVSMLDFGSVHPLDRFPFLGTNIPTDLGSTLTTVTCGVL